MVKVHAEQEQQQSSPESQQPPGPFAHKPGDPRQVRQVQRKEHQKENEETEQDCLGMELERRVMLFIADRHTLVDENESSKPGESQQKQPAAPQVGCQRCSLKPPAMLPNI